MKCVSCGANIYDDVNRCQYCGAYQPTKPQNVPPQAGQASQPTTVIYNIVQSAPPSQTHIHNAEERQNLSDKSRWVALILCLLGGVIGLHKFYVGKTGMGVLYLFTAGLCGIGVFVDIIALLFNGSSDKWGRRLRS